MDDLAAQFQLKTVDAVNRLKFLIENGSLTGVVDDRGKFIYITEEELNAGLFSDELSNVMVLIDCVQLLNSSTNAGGYP